MLLFFVSMTFICVIQSIDSFISCVLRRLLNERGDRMLLFFCFVDIHLCDTID